MKENYQIYLPYQFHWRLHSVGGDSQLPHKKMKTLFLSNMSKSRRLTSTFFPTRQLYSKLRTFNTASTNRMQLVILHRSQLSLQLRLQSQFDVFIWIRSGSCLSSLLLSHAFNAASNMLKTFKVVALCKWIYIEII